MEEQWDNLCQVLDHTVNQIVGKFLLYLVRCTIGVQCCFTTYFLFMDLILGTDHDYRANIADLDEVAHYEPPHLDLCCL